MRANITFADYQFLWSAACKLSCTLPRCEGEGVSDAYLRAVDARNPISHTSSRLAEVRYLPEGAWPSIVFSTRTTISNDSTIKNKSDNNPDTVANPRTVPRLY